MRKFGFRRILPAIQVSLFILLSVTRLLVEEPSFLQPIWRLYEAINLPVLVVVGVFREQIGWFSPVPEIVDLLAAAVLVVALWYHIGLWLDRRLGLEPPRDYLPDTLGRAVGWLVLLIAVVVSLFLLVSFVSRPSIAGASRLPVAAWCGFGAVVVALKIRRWRRLASR